MPSLSTVFFSLSGHRVSPNTIHRIGQEVGEELAAVQEDAWRTVLRGEVPKAGLRTGFWRGRIRNLCFPGGVYFLLMGLAFLITVFSALNLAVGFGLAMFLGYGPASLREAWDALEEHAGRPAERPAQPAPQAVAPAAEAAAESPPLGDLLDEGDDAVEMVPYDEPYDDLAEVAPGRPEAWEIAEKFIETSILKLNLAMSKSGTRAAEVDARLRACRGKTEAGTIRRCLDELIADCEIYLAEQSEAAERFHSRLSELGELAPLGAEIERGNREDAEQIAAMLAVLRGLSPEGDLEAINARLLEELSRLRIARHKLRDRHEEAFLAIARYENRLAAIDPALINDPLTSLRNRVGIESLLAQWWEQGRHQARPMSAAMLDLDGTDQLNREHGPKLVDAIVAEVARTIAASIGKGDVAGRWGGQRFFLLLSDVGPRAAIKTAEYIRQAVARTTFQHGQTPIAVTLGCGITEVQKTDGNDVLVSRVERALAGAKQAGAGRACFHNGKELEPVESPNLGAEYREIAV